MNNNKGKMRDGVAVFSTSSFVLNLAFSLSLDLLWSMINALQVIVFLPLFNVSFSAMVTTLSNALIAITNFTIIPYESLNNLFFDFDPQVQQRITQSNINQYGIGSRNLIVNTEVTFWIYHAWFLVAFVAILLNLFN